MGKRARLPSQMVVRLRINQRDSRVRTPLPWEASLKHFAVFKFRLNGFFPNSTHSSELQLCEMQTAKE